MIPNTTGGYVTFPATELVQAWVDGSQPNHGFFVLAVPTTSAERTFQSHEPISHGHNPPRLVVGYSPPYGAIYSGRGCDAGAVYATGEWLDYLYRVDGISSATVRIRGIIGGGSTILKADHTVFDGVTNEDGTTLSSTTGPRDIVVEIKEPSGYRELARCRITVVAPTPTPTITRSPTPTRTNSPTSTVVATPSATRPASPTATAPSTPSATPTPTSPTDTPTAVPTETPVVTLVPPPDAPLDPVCSIFRPRGGLDAHVVEWAEPPIGATNVHVEVMNRDGTWSELGEAKGSATSWTRLIEYDDFAPPEPRFRLRSHRHGDGAYSSYVEVPPCTLPFVAEPDPTPVLEPPSPTVACPVAACMVIDFETEADGVTPIEPGTSVERQYEELYPTYSRSVIVVPAAGTISPDQSLQATAGGTTVGFSGPLVVHFARPQSYVALAIGVGPGSVVPVEATLRAYRKDASEPVAISSAMLGGGEQPVTTVLAIDRGTRPDFVSGDAVRVRDISRIEVEIQGGSAELIDDLTFDVFGKRPLPPPPPCLSVAEPVVELDPLPPTVSENLFSLGGIVRFEQEPIAATVIIDGAEVGQHTVHPLKPIHLYLHPVSFNAGERTLNVANFTNMLFPGSNELTVSIGDGYHTGVSMPLEITFVPPFDTPPEVCPAPPPGHPDPAAPAPMYFEGKPDGAVLGPQFLSEHGLVFPEDRPGHIVELAGWSTDRFARMRSIEGVHAGPLVIRFTNPQRRVRMSAGIDGAGGPGGVLRAYDRPIGGALLDEDALPSVRNISDPLVGVGEVEASATADIHRVEFEVEGDGIEAIDDLVLYRACDPLPAAPSTVDISVAGMEITQVVNKVLSPPRPPGSTSAYRGQYAGVPLVKGKQTVVRVYGALSGASQPISGVRARLSVLSGSGPLADTALGVLEPVASFGGPAGHRIRLDPGRTLDALRADARLSWNFILPLTWIRDADPFAVPDPGPLQLRLIAEINTPSTVKECAAPECLANNQLSIYDVEFKRTGALQVNPVYITVEKGTANERTATAESAECTFWDRQIGSSVGGTGTPTDLCEAAGMEASMPGFVQRLYPVAEGGVLISNTVRRIKRGDSTDTNGSFRDDLLTQLCEKYTYDTIFGLIPYTAVGTWTRGLSKLDYACAIGNVADQSTAAHEVGHTAGLKHAGEDHGEGCLRVTIMGIGYVECEDSWPYPHGGIGEFGFNTRTMEAMDPGEPRPDKPHAHDLMSYGDPYWISPRNYCRLLDKFGAGTSDYCEYHRSLSADLESGDRVDIGLGSDTVDRTDRELGQNAGDRVDLAHGRDAGGSVAVDTGARTAGLTPGDYMLVRGRISAEEAVIAPLYTVTLDEPPPVHEAGEITLELRDDEGGVLSTTPVKVAWTADDDDGPTASFTAYVPPNDAGHRLVALVGETEIAQRVRSSNAPTILSTEPGAGDTWESNGNYAVGWQSQDLDGDAVVHRVEYSPDEGRTWIEIAMDDPAESLDLDAADMPGGDRALIRVTASDGFLSAMDVTSSSFSVAKKSPQLKIVAAGEGTAFATGAAGLLAIGSDREDGDVDPATLLWSVDGALIAEGTDYLPGSTPSS